MKDPLAFVREATRDYGDTVRVGAIGRQHVFLITHPSHVHYILQGNNRNYSKGDDFKQIKLIIGDGLVIAEGEEWRRQRRLMQPAFHKQKIRGLVDAMAKVIGGVREQWAAIPRGEPLDISSEMMKLAQRVLLRALLSVEAETENAELMAAWDEVHGFLSGRLFSIVNLPVALPFPSHIRFRRAMKKLDDAVKRILAHRRGSDEGPEDLLSLLLAARDEATGTGMTAEELRDEVMTIFAAGFETTAVVLAWAWLLVSQHPEVEEKLFAEVDSVLEGHAPTSEDIPRLRYTKMILEETMRLYPSAWIFTRTNLEADTIGGYSIPKGSLLFVCPYATHRRAEEWQDPEVFSPERFAEACPGRPRFGFYPFGGGPRQCIGEAFAMTEMQLVIAIMAQRFTLRAEPGLAVEPEPLFTLRSRPAIRMTLSERRGPAGRGPL
jgi:cytochrome P450